MSDRRQVVFIVRMWSEPSSGAEPTWRGSVDDARSSSRVYFSNLGTMCEFMLERRRAAAAEMPACDTDLAVEKSGD